MLKPKRQRISKRRLKRKKSTQKGLIKTIVFNSGELIYPTLNRTPENNFFIKFCQTNRETLRSVLNGEIEIEPVSSEEFEKNIRNLMSKPQPISTQQPTG